MSTHVAVLGAGLAGLAAAQRLREDGASVDVYEKEPGLGGHARSHRIEGFTFDEGPHVSFTARPEIQQLFAAAVGGEYLESDAIVTNYYGGHWVRHPAQCNLFGLPVELVERCVVDFVRAHYEDKETAIQNYADWCYRQLGQTFSESFTFRYTRKFWTADPREMTTDWIGPRVHRPTIEEMVRGALGRTTRNHHYITRFRYPRKGGFGAYVSGVARGQAVLVDHEVVEIDLPHRRLNFANGRAANFERLVSSLPLPDLIRLIKDAPRRVVEAASRLLCTSLVLVDVGISRSEWPDVHWMYFYDDDLIFARGSLPHRLSPSNAPLGCGSVQVEVYHSRYRPLETGDVLGRAMDDLYRTGLLRRDDRVLVARERRIPYANVLFDHERIPNLTVVRDYLTEIGIVTCGRYGEWDYHWTDDSIVSGWRAVDGLTQRVASNRPTASGPCE
jgi:protoporphyrinogen oxidase